MTELNTDILEIHYEDGGAVSDPAILLLHGWPDDVRGWREVAPRLRAMGYRTITPYLRGFGPTRFLSPDTIRDGRGVALAQDALDLMDGLGVQRFAIVGHDWGARAAYSLAALFPHRVTHVVGAALAFQPGAAFRTSTFSQARSFWYQWFMSVDAGAAAVKADPRGFARLQWETWSPRGWFDTAEFEETARSFDNPDWVAVTLSGYRSRWTRQQVDPRYEALQQRLTGVYRLATPTLMIQGGADFCDEPAGSEGMEDCFTAGYQRLLLDGIGHFPPREAPGEVAEAVHAFIKGCDART
ncbi:alpha/beta fold hydrolase [Caulobacter sp. S45]|uniref:alpha/beta fold hydrolase n=1 Tax=Caulobacter sp. S45 TaxID=1641861 RepID=UPI00131E7A2C|nr:alpha/beta hydrolase [Caulobacter sp. S45]